MANLDLDESSANFQIRSYKPGTIKINETVYTQSVIVTPDELIDNWAPQTAEQLTVTSLIPVLAFKPDVLLIGTGGTHIFIPAEIYGELINQGIGVEIMDTSAACRTYNALTAENRRVVAALLIR